MDTTIQLSISESILLALESGKEDFVTDLLYNNAVMLYKKNKLSLGKAAEMAGYVKMDFIDKLQKENIPIFDYDLDTIKKMVDDSDKAMEIINKK
jgi:predicted HTH domain antitoxin